MPVASDILASAKEFTERYAQQVVSPTDRASAGSLAAPQGIPAHVFVLLQSGTVLGVLTVEQKAIEEANSLMNAYASVCGSAVWTTLAQNRIWRSNDGIIIEISAHDVR